MRTLINVEEIYYIKGGYLWSILIYIEAGYKIGVSGSYNLSFFAETK